MHQCHRLFLVSYLLSRVWIKKQGSHKRKIKRAHLSKVNTKQRANFRFCQKQNKINNDKKPKTTTTKDGWYRTMKTVKRSRNCSQFHEDDFQTRRSGKEQELLKIDLTALFIECHQAVSINGPFRVHRISSQKWPKHVDFFYFPPQKLPKHVEIFSFPLQK